MERKHKRASKTDSLLNLFVNTIWEKDGMLQQEVEAPQKETDPIEPETMLQYKFTYSDDEESVPEKSDYEKEIDQLWDEMDFALRSSEDSTSAPSTAAVEEEIEQPVGTDPYTSCTLGKHQPILHEEIGLICMFCSFVLLERRYILPDFATPSAKGRQDKRMSVGNEEFPMSDSFPLYATSGDQGSNLRTSGPVRDKLDKFPWKLYPHQIEGIEFLWKNLAGGIDVDTKNTNPSHEVGGCIISHAPGTGKTLLTIAFLRTFMETFPDCKPVLMAPSSMLLTWEQEFKKWNVGIKFHNLSSLKFSGDEDCAARKLVGNRRSTSWRHIVKAFSWCKGNSILAVSYQIFEKLATEEPGEDKEEIPGYTAEMRKIILEKPGLVILDEGHTPRNKNSKIYKCLKKLKTERRIILSGTPFQNNFDELFTTMWLVRPKFADTISSATEKRGEELRGDWVSLTSSIGKSSQDQLLEKIQKMIEPFVHVHEGSILEKKLPGLREYVVVLHPPPLQKKLLAKVREGMKNSFELDRAIAVVSVHPHLLTKCKCSVAKQSKTGKSCVTTLIDDNKQIKEDAYRLNFHEGVKTRFLMQLIKLSEAMNEKVLVFSQFLDPHSLVCDHLFSTLGWRMGEEIIQIDGSLDVNKRQVLINRFNDPNSKVKVLLASTKACGEGISLTGASRLVLLDVVWNPSVQKQAISRAYRLGQKKVVYTYNLITSGTLEEDKYCVQSRKHHLSQLVFSTEHGKTENPDNPSSKFSDDKILQEMMGNEELKGMFDKIIPKESTLLETLGGAPSIQS
ncbi:hypothetical protein MKW94_002220 [Papaver nudicaule]|uniref:Uncharacterized protein n=1 Tax=Papaver nudicaule TaxID=74823 RepID=A0AA41V040_PAPNU|nr:hypothetical protein [Papaver nudicaule]